MDGRKEEEKRGGRENRVKLSVEWVAIPTGKKSSAEKEGGLG